MSSRPARESYDVVVIGGGPAGTCAATLVAREGRTVLLLDRESFPRFRIGESLMPATYWTLERLGVLDKMKGSHFPSKHSVQFFSGGGRSTHPFYFSEFDSHESSVTWQVDRGEFDQMLLDHAAATGVEVHQRANVKDVLFDGSRATGVRVELADGSRSEVEASVIVDASGQTAMLARRLGLQEFDDRLRHVSYFTRYSGAWRGAGRDEGSTLILHTENDESWFWYIPLPGDVVSVGVVGPVDYLRRQHGGDPQTVYDEELEICPALQEKIRGAQQLTPVSVLRDFSYISRRIAGDGWVLAGDAFGFLDPIYSSGVFLALKSGEGAADSILDAFARQDFSGARLGQHGDAYLDGMEALRKLVYAYYDKEFSIGEFVKQHPDCRAELVDLLIGNVYRRPPKVLFERMVEMCALPEARRLVRPDSARTDPTA